MVINYQLDIINEVYNYVQHPRIITLLVITISLTHSKWWAPNRIRPQTCLRNRSNCRSSAFNSDKAAILQPMKRFFLRDWQPSLGGAFRSILVARMISAFCMHISDCDETYNYWEPVRLCAL